jgi:hypothetical protein
VGPVRHRNLIRLLSLLVAMNMVVGLAALWARSGDTGGSEATAQISPDTVQNGSILAGGRFSRPRGSKDRTARTVPTAPAETTTTTASPPPTAPPTTAAPPPTAPPTTATTRETTRETRSPRGSTSTTRPAPATTTTHGPVATPGPQAAAAGEVSPPGTLTDPEGDTFVDGTNGPIKEGRADLVRVGSAYAADAITFVAQVARPLDPRKDERWASDSTYVSWEVDTNGDATPDFEVQYYRLDEENVGGSVTRPGDSGEAVCDDISATYSADGFKISIAPACLGNPASFAYRASIFYDTNPADENADVASDVTPNGGMSFAIRRP